MAKRKKITKAQLQSLGSNLEWQLEDQMDSYDSLIRQNGGISYKVYSSPVRLVVELYDYDLDEYVKATLKPKADGSLSVAIYDSLNKKLAKRDTWKVLGSNPALRLWKLFSKADSAFEVWNSYR